MTPSRETGRALRRAQEDFRRDQRKLKQLLEKQRQRYDKASHAMEAEAQVHLRVIVHIKCTQNKKRGQVLAVFRVLVYSR